MAPSLHTRADDRGARGVVVRSHRRGGTRPETGDRDARHCRRALGGDRAAVEDRTGFAGRRVTQDDDRVDRGQPERAVVREARDPLDAEQVVIRIGGGQRPQRRRHRVRERARGAWMHPDLGRQLGIGHQRRHGPFGKVEPIGDRRHRGGDVVRGEVAERRAHGNGV